MSTNTAHLLDSHVPTPQSDALAATGRGLSDDRQRALSRRQFAGDDAVQRAEDQRAGGNRSVGAEQQRGLGALCSELDSVESRSLGERACRSGGVYHRAYLLNWCNHAVATHAVASHDIATWWFRCNPSRLPLRIFQEHECTSAGTSGWLTSSSSARRYCSLSSNGFTRIRTCFCSSMYAHGSRFITCRFRCFRSPRWRLRCSYTVSPI